ncbi:MAG: hypothetical protein COB04_07375 [Gammaproteobacteria bacterium]|nr:MAG: hypothetical protein COB04_07375 [Gammaproteobacteria bacterium]
MQEDHAERRDYYRINDQIMLEYRLLSESEYSSHGEPPSDPYDTHYHITPEFKILSEIRQIEADSKHHLHAISEQDRHISAYLRALNHKIECLTSLITQSQDQNPLTPTHQVSLSEAGIAVEVPDHITQDSLLHIHVTLFPSFYRFAAIAKTIHCDTRADANNTVFHLGLHFESMLESDRQMLARHILQKQSQDRRKTQIPPEQ